MRALPPTAWNDSSPYERYMGRWSRQLAPLFLEWLGCPAGLTWLDLGCGTGALSVAIVRRCDPAKVIGVEPSRGFLNAARANLDGRAALLQGSAAAIPLSAGSVDRVVSGLVLNFVPDPAAALAEMDRVARRGALVAAYVWDYGGRMEFVRHFWDAAVAVDPGAAAFDQGRRHTICRPDALSTLFSSAGLRSVETTALDAPTVFAGFDDYWQPFFGGTGAAPTYIKTLSEEMQNRLRAQLQQQLPVQADGTIPLIARAWAVRGER